MKIKLFVLTALLGSLLGFEIPHTTVIPDNAYGVWQVPALEIDVPLYTSTHGNGQDVVDREGAALVRGWGKGKAICDHADSQHGDSYWNVNQMQVGGSAFLITADGTLWYRCDMICRVKNTGTGYICTPTGHTVHVQQDDVICLSCTDEDGYEWLAYFTCMGEFP